LEETRIVKRGDSFDIGGLGELTESESGNLPQTSDDIIIRLLSNPKGLANSLGLTEKQAKNIASIITGGGAGLGHQLLADAIGPELAGAIGGFLGGYVSKKVVGKKPVSRIVRGDSFDVDRQENVSRDW